MTVKNEDCLSTQSSKERGAIIVLAVLVLAVLFGFIAIAIDSARTLTTMTEKISTADSIALAALDTYLNKEPPSAICPAPASNACRHNYKWGQVLGQVVTYYNTNQSTFTNIQNITTANINQSGKGVEIKPGRWWIQKPASCTAADMGCPCQAITAPLFRPCFEECSPASGCSSSSGDIFATAMEVKLSTVGQGGVMTLFARGMGVDKLDVEGRAYSASSGSVSFSLPQIGVLLFDLSRAMTIDNYLPFERNPLDPGVSWAARREYSFPVAGGACSANGTPSTCLGTCPIATVSSLSPDYPVTAYQTEYTTGPYTSADYNRYACYSGTLNGVTESHLIATEAGSLDPEPYWSMLRAANVFLTKFKSQGRAGDRIMVLGFDTTDVPEWHFPRASSGMPVFLAATDPALDDLILMTSSRVEAAKKLFIPRANSKLDLAKALKVAGDQILAAYPTIQIDPYITLFSNGFSLCGSNNPGAPSTFTAYCASLTPPGTGPAAQTLHLENFRKQITSLDEAVVAGGESYLKPNGIKVHVVTGNSSNVMPIGVSAIPAHSALIGHWFSSPSVNRCANDSEIRQWKYLNVLPYPDDISPSVLFGNRMVAEFSNIGRTTASSLSNVNPINPPALPSSPPVANNFLNIVRYIQPTKYLYSLAATTLGYYVPLRRECAVTTRAMADGFCVLPGKRLSGTPPTTTTRITATRARTYKPLPPGTNEIDADGRMLCEPKDGSASAPATLISQFSDNVVQTRTIALVMPD